MPQKKTSTLEKRKSPTQLRSRNRVELIVQATVLLLREEGLAAVTTNAIAARAGIPVSSVYQYFPNKILILVDIYRDYLGRVRQVLIDFADPKYLAMERGKYFDALFRAIFEAETRDHIEVELQMAMGLYPELAEVDRLHREQTADLLAGLIQQRGARWSKPKLRRLALFLYAINSGMWAYRSEVQPPRKEIQEWEWLAGQAVLNRCFE